jgi:hypothetical protein
MMLHPRIFDGVEPNGNLLTGVRDAMVSLIPPDTPPIDDQIARILLAKGYTPGVIAEHLDAVVFVIFDRHFIECNSARGRYGDDED